MTVTFIFEFKLFVICCGHVLYQSPYWQFLILFVAQYFVFLFVLKGSLVTYCILVCFYCSIVCLILFLSGQRPLKCLYCFNFFTGILRISKLVFNISCFIRNLCKSETTETSRTMTLIIFHFHLHKVAAYFPAVSAEVRFISQFSQRNYWINDIKLLYENSRHSVSCWTYQNAFRDL